MAEDSCGHLSKCFHPFHDHGEPDARLSKLVDPEDPALDQIVEILTEMSAAGVDFTPEIIKVAVKMAHHRYRREHIPRQTIRATRRGDRSGGSVVYYVRRGNLVKIGTTVSLQDRMNVLMPDEILAVEPGGAEVERQRHREFAALRVKPRSEYFYPGRALQQHISRVLREHGAPPEDMPTLQGSSRNWS